MNKNPSHPPACMVLPGRDDCRLLLLCDHATNDVPAELGGTLGLSDADMARHIAYDIGARGLAEGLAQRLGATLIMARWSRLVIDPNRGADDPTLVRRIYDGSVIPGNRGADRDEVARRHAAYYAPYDQTIAAAIRMIEGRGQRPILVSIHSFTPGFIGRAPRPWHVGVLWDGMDGRIARPLISALRAEGDLSVGDNEPYTGGNPGETLMRHATPRDLPNVLIEVRNDLIETQEQQGAWAERLAPHISDMTTLPGV